MPFGISQSQPDCAQWATVKEEADGSYTTIGCHATKQDAIDQMVVVSLSEEMEPLGQVDRMSERSTVIYNYGTVHITQSEVEIESENEGEMDEETEPEGEMDEETEPEESGLGYEERQPSLVAPSFMAESAKRGLRLHEQGLSGDGLMPATVADARRMANGEPLSEAKWRKIPAWIARHIGDLAAVEGDEITPGLVAMLLWGGGSSRESALRAQGYAERIVSQMDEERAPAAPSEQIKGSDENPAGSAADKTGGITLSDATEKALQTKADEHNAAMTDGDRPVWSRVRVDALRAVYRRGAGAFSTSHRPGMTRGQWAMARVNAFLYLARTGSPENENYVGDNDLLHPEHPRYSDTRTSRGDSTMMAATMSDLIEQRWCITGSDERRIAYTTLDLRQADNGTTLYGYAAVFDSPSEPMPFIEYVKRGAFSKTLKDGADVRLLIDHEGVPLARSKSGTLRMSEDERGLAVEADLDPMNPDAARVISAMRRGDLSQMSFAFRTIKDSWNDERTVRELREVQLFDVSVVTFPAYEQTVAEIRGRALRADEPQPMMSSASTSVNVRAAQIAIARHKK
jgi:HK97 family phage prohead protease